MAYSYSIIFDTLDWGSTCQATLAVRLRSVSNLFAASLVEKGAEELGLSHTVAPMKKDFGSEKVQVLECGRDESLAQAFSQMLDKTMIALSVGKGIGICADGMCGGLEFYQQDFVTWQVLLGVAGLSDPVTDAEFSEAKSKVMRELLKAVARCLDATARELPRHAESEFQLLKRQEKFLKGLLKNKTNDEIMLMGCEELFRSFEAAGAKS